MHEHLRKAATLEPPVEPDERVDEEDLKEEFNPLVWKRARFRVVGNTDTPIFNVK